MSKLERTRRSLSTAIRESFFRIAASGVVPARWVLPSLPDPEPRKGPLELEIVTHCWNYAHLLAYQLSSLVLHPPARLSVRMTVFHSPDDEQTRALLAFFERKQIDGVTWNWQRLERPELFRRAIGRNRAARATKADWIWFTDCDVVFHEGCLDALAERLEGRADRLVYPHEERVTDLLAEDDPMLRAAADGPRIVEIDPSRFHPSRRGRATGPMQIVHGDVARECGYCASLTVWQEPAERWQKAHEDRAFRWLLRTEGEPIEVPGVFRIRHAVKGRYRAETRTARIRGAIRRVGSRLKDMAQGKRSRGSG